MEVSLHNILSHPTFDWSCRNSKVALSKNLEEIVKDLSSLRKVDTNPSSPVFKAAIKIYDLVKKNKNLGKEKFVERESKTLENYVVKLEEKQGEADEGKSEKEENTEDVKMKNAKEDEGKVPVEKRKSFGDLKSKRQKTARVNNIINIIKEDAGVEDEVVARLKMAKEDSADKSEKEEEFKMACLNAMKTLSLSDTKYDDLRFWLFDMIQRGFNLLDMPASTTLKAKVRKEMIPSDMSSSETGAEFDISVALFHTGKRFLERPDIRQHLKDGDTVQHLAKVGADFATGFGKVQQVKQSEFDEDGSHNTGFQTLKLTCGEQDLFVNKAAGGSELLRLVSKTTHKDTAERMVAEMEALDKLCQAVPKQEVHLEGVGLVQVEHRLVNTLHDGKERLAMTQHKV